MEAREQRDGDKDDDRFLAVADLELCDRVSAVIDWATWRVWPFIHSMGHLLTSRAETNCSGLSALFMSGMLDSRSYRAPAMLVSSSLGRCLDGLVGVILLRDAILVVFDLQRDPSE